MKYLLIILLLISFNAVSQTTYIISADSTKLRKNGANNELIIENSTRATTGVLTNYLNGRTRFMKPRISGDTLFIGIDTLLFSSVSIANNGLVKASNGYIGLDSNSINPLSRNVEIDLNAKSFSIEHSELDMYFKLTPAFGELEYNAFSPDFFKSVSMSLSPDDGFIQAVDTNTIYLLGVGVGGTSDGTGVIMKTSDLNNMSLINVKADSITFKPGGGGKMNIDSLRTSSDTTTYKPMSRDPATGILVQHNYWPGGSGATPTLQQVLDAGSTLTSNEQVNLDANQLSIYADDASHETFVAITSDETYINRTPQIGGAGATFRISDSLFFKVQNTSGPESWISIYADSIVNRSSNGDYRFKNLSTTAQARVAMVGTNGRLYSVDTTGLFGGGGGSGLTVGTTTITSGTDTRVLYNNAGVLGEYTTTGTGTELVKSTSPTFITGITSPLVIGGTGTGSTLTYKTTTGVGATDAHIWQVGNNGATEAMRIVSSGNVGVGTTSPVGKFTTRLANSAITPTSIAAWDNTTFLIGNGSDATTQKGMGINFDGTTSWRTLYIQPGTAWHSSSEYMSYKAFFSGGSTTPSMVITSGKVSINQGVGVPAEALDVAGNIKTTGYKDMADISTPSTPGAGFGRWYVNTDAPWFKNDGGTAFEIIKTASVNSVSPTAPDRTITVVIGGVTLYIAAKTTND